MTTQGRSRSGYSAWRLIAEELRREIIGGSQAPGTKLPSEGELAERFGVHRNTVRQAVAALAAEHLVVSRRGSGTFVAEQEPLGDLGGGRRLDRGLEQRARGAAATAQAVAEAGARADAVHQHRVLRDESPAAAAGDDEVLGGQRRDGLADGVPVHAETLGEFPF